jgi:hypothetical protein
MLSQSILTNLKLLTRKHSKKELNKKLKSKDLEFIIFICEICKNLDQLHSHYRIDPKTLKTLKKFDKHIKAIASDHLSIPEKTLVAQKGGFLPLLIASAAPVLLEFVLDHFLKKKK